MIGPVSLRHGKGYTMWRWNASQGNLRKTNDVTNFMMSFYLLFQCCFLDLRWARPLMQQSVHGPVGC